VDGDGDGMVSPQDFELFFTKSADPLWLEVGGGGGGGKDIRRRRRRRNAPECCR